MILPAPSSLEEGNIITGTKNGYSPCQPVNIRGVFIPDKIPGNRNVIKTFIVGIPAAGITYTHQETVRINMISGSKVTGIICRQVF